MSSTQVDTQRILGQVKWFNNKEGYGFITVSEGEHSGKDIFIHYSTINVTVSQYKYLVQGESIEFTLEKSSSEKHDFQAAGVSGVKGGKLMCEARRMNSASQHGDEPHPTSTYRRYRVSRGGPRNEESGDDFTRVKSKKRQGGNVVEDAAVAK